jgi:hypothetical protein
MPNRVTPEERAAIKREVMAEIFQEMGRHDSYNDLLDAVDNGEHDAGPTMADISQMSESEINEHWDDVSATLARTPPPVSDDGEPPLPTGLQPISRESLARMSEYEITARRTEIDAFLERGAE